MEPTCKFTGGARMDAGMKTDKQPPELPIPPEELAGLISQLASATAQTRRFLSHNDLLLLPSQALALDPLLRSSALSLSRILPLLPPLPSLPPPPNPPSSSWFLRFLSSTSSVSDTRWLETFRMSRTSFYLLLQTLSPSLSSSPLHVPLDHKLAAALFRLAHAAPLRAVARRFGLPSPAAACRAFYEVCKAIADALAHLFELPSDLPRVLQGFHWMSLPNCCGVLGYARFPIERAGKVESLIAQGLVDSEGRFLDVSVGWHGSMLTSLILKESKLYKSQAMFMAPGPPVQLNGGSVKRYLLGGPSCPLLPWLLTPFPADSESPNAAVFNSVHARGMELADGAFRRVRARWQLLQTTWRQECAEALPYIIVASCLLHNFLIKCSEPMPDEALVLNVEPGFPHFPDTSNSDHEGGHRAREVLAYHLSSVRVMRK